MNEPFNNDLRRIGGLSRDKDRPEWERKFMGMLAGSSRPLKNDHPAAQDVKLAVNVLREESAKFPWVILSLVGRDGRSVRGNDPSLSDAEIVARVHQMGGAIGLAGLIFLTQKNKHSLVTFVRPFTAKEGTIDRLTGAMETIKPEAVKLLKNEVAQNGDDESLISLSPFTAKLYLNENLDRASIYYSWEQDQPDPSFQFVGVFYVVRDEPGKWKPRARATNPRWSAAMAEAMPRFEKKSKEVLELLGKLQSER